MEGKNMKEVVYGDCRRNHSALLGMRATDGCGEYIADNNKPDAFYCAACGCHRNFHRKIHAVPSDNKDDDDDVADVVKLLEYRPALPRPPSSVTAGGDPRYLQQAVLANMMRSGCSSSNRGFVNPYQQLGVGYVNRQPVLGVGFANHQLLGMGMGMGMEVVAAAPGGYNNNHHHHQQESSGGAEKKVVSESESGNGSGKKRGRGRFSEEEKDKLRELAFRIGWSMPRSSKDKREEDIERVCREFRINRNTFKHWMNNQKKHVFKSDTPPAATPADPAPSISAPAAGAAAEPAPSPSTPAPAAESAPSAPAPAPAPAHAHP